MSNRQDPEFYREISGSEKSLTDAAAAGKRTSEARILNVLEFFGPLESPLQKLTTVDGTSIWAGDGVHLTSNATRVAAMKLMADIGGGETTEPANKRARLESVIPVKTAPLPAASAAAAAQASPAPALAVWPAVGKPARQSPLERPAAGRPGRPKYERSAAGICVDAPPKGWEQGRTPGRPPRPLRPLVKVYQESVFLPSCKTRNKQKVLKNSNTRT